MQGKSEAGSMLRDAHGAKLRVVVTCLHWPKVSWPEQAREHHQLKAVVEEDQARFRLSRLADYSS